METTTPSATSSTPMHLWIVGIVALLWNGFGAFDYVMTQMNVESYMGQFTPEQREYFAGYPAWATGAWALAIWSSVLGSLALLLRRKWAVWLFGVALVGMVISSIYTLGLSEGTKVMGGAAVAFTAVIWVVAIGLFLYSRMMASRGVLR
jgi:hypothetical protein